MDVLISRRDQGISDTLLGFFLARSRAAGDVGEVSVVSVSYFRMSLCALFVS